MLEFGRDFVPGHLVPGFGRSLMLGCGFDLVLGRGRNLMLACDRKLALGCGKNLVVW